MGLALALIGDTEIARLVLQRAAEQYAFHAGITDARVCMKALQMLAAHGAEDFAWEFMNHQKLCYLQWAAGNALRLGTVLGHEAEVSHKWFEQWLMPSNLQTDQPDALSTLAGWRESPDSETSVQMAMEEVHEILQWSRYQSLSSLPLASIVCAARCAAALGYTSLAVKQPSLLAWNTNLPQLELIETLAESGEPAGDALLELAWALSAGPARLNAAFR